MGKRKNIIRKFFSKELSEEEKQEFLKTANEDKSFIKSFVQEIELHDAIDEFTGNNLIEKAFKASKVKKK